MEAGRVARSSTAGAFSTPSAITETVVVATSLVRCAWCNVMLCVGLSVGAMNELPTWLPSAS